jgi:hypothetical protein
MYHKDDYIVSLTCHWKRKGIITEFFLIFLKYFSQNNFDKHILKHHNIAKVGFKHQSNQINQSINQSINHKFNQSITNSINQSQIQSINHKFNY